MSIEECRKQDDFPQGCTHTTLKCECALRSARIYHKRLHFCSLIENARSYTTSPKYAEWQTGINNSLPLLEEAFNKLRALDIPSAEKDIIEPVKTAVNTPFMQVCVESNVKHMLPLHGPTPVELTLRPLPADAQMIK